MGWDRGYSLLLFSTVRCNGAPCLCLDCTATLLNPPSQKVFERQQRRRTTDGRASPSAHRPFVEDSEESYVGSGVVHLVATSEVRQKHAGIFTATLHFWWHKGHEMRHDAMKAQTETERGQARRNEQQIYHRTGVFFCRTSLVIRFSNQARQREGTKQNQARQRCLGCFAWNRPPTPTGGGICSFATQNVKATKSPSIHVHPARLHSRSTKAEVASDIDLLPHCCRR